MREDIIKNRLSKLENLIKAGMDPYPEETQRSFVNTEALEHFNELAEKTIFLVGRIKSLRPMGNAVFAHIEDGAGKIQIFLSKKDLAPDKFKLFLNNIEIGDFVEVKGKMFKTKSGEKTLKAADWKILSKSIRPIPTEYYGLKDTEKLLRKRYLDLMMNAETREIFRKKAKFWQFIRSYLVRNGFLEVDTPVLEAIPGGADARPFITHHNALDRDFYLRISLELPLKRLLVGGYERVFEIGKVFRNEGIDAEHLQDYLHMEFYWAYCDMKKGMAFIEEMYREIIKEITGKYEHKYDGYRINWKNKLPIFDYFAEFKNATGLDLKTDLSLETFRAKADELGVKYENSYGKGRMIDLLYKKTVRPKLIQPCFLVGHPLEVSPLAKKDSDNPRKVRRVQIVAGGSELCNAFAELNDPLDQRARFLEQMKMREAGDEEAQMLDEDFIEALEYGMPPAFGFGMSERFFAFIMNKSVRETVIFPPMKEK